MLRPHTEVWWRNPKFYIEQLAEVGACNLVWDAGYIARRRFDPWLYAQRMLAGHPWQSLVIDDYFAQLRNYESTEIKAVWQVWSAADDDMYNLVKMVETPYSKKVKSSDVQVIPDRRPVEGQKHVVVISNLPNMHYLGNKALLADLVEIQEENPDVTLMIHGAYSFGYLFGTNFKMVDHEPRTRAATGQVDLPTGKRVDPDILKGPKNSFWAHLLGHTASELKSSPSQRCVYNIKATLWAGTYFRRLEKFGINKKRGLDDPRLEAFIKQNNLIFTKRIAVKPGDRVVCDDCSLWLHCKYFREGAICAVPHTDMDKVGELFGTRNADDIVRGLGKLLEVQTARAKTALESEKIATEGVDPNLNKLMNEIFASGVTLLKIVDPSQRTGGTKISISQTGGGTTQIGAGPNADPAEMQRQLVQNAIIMLEQRGLRREEMTEELLKEQINWIVSQGNQQAISSTAT